MSLSQIIKQLFELIKKHKIITGLVVLLLIYILTQSTKKITPTGENTPDTEISPTIIVTPTQTEPFDLTDGDPQYPLRTFLPYKGNGFTINRYLAPLNLEVIIKNESQIPIIEPRLREWLKDKELIRGENIIIWKYEE